MFRYKCNCDSVGVVHMNIVITQEDCISGESGNVSLQINIFALCTGRVLLNVFPLIL